MSKNKILNKSLSINFNKKEVENAAKIQVPKEVTSFLANSGASISFPYEYLKIKKKLCT